MIAYQRYRRLLARPGVGSSILASIPGRLPIGVAAFALVLFVQSRSGSFAPAGAVGAAYVLGLGCCAPLLGRVIDRASPRPVLIISAVGYPLALILLVLLVRTGASAALIYPCAFAAGALLPPITVCMRALYPRLLHDAGELQTAYSVDSVLIESMFIAGPLLVSLLVAGGHADGAVLLAALAGAAGNLVFLRAPAVRAWNVAPATAARDVWGPLRLPRLRGLYAITFIYAATFGLFEIAITAHATRAGAPAAAGALLAAGSAGSALGGLVYGSHDWRLPPQRQFVLALLLMALGVLLLAPVSNLALFGVLCVVGCAPMAPVLAIQSVLTSRLSPPHMAAESFTWGATCLLAGIGAGTSTGGVLVEQYSPAAALYTAAAMAAGGGLMAALSVKADA